MSFRTRLLARVDRIREIPEKRFDMRQNTVDVVVRTWSGTVPGDGTMSEVRTRLFVHGSYNIRVQNTSSKDVVASGGLLSMQDLKVGPFTPSYPGGGLDNPAFDPVFTGQAREVLFLVKGKGMGDAGRWFRRVNDSSLRNYTTMLYLTATGENHD